MTPILLVALLSGLLPAQAPAAAQTAPPMPPPATVPAATVSVTLTTAEGPIVLALEKDRAPVTTANFLRYVDGKKLDGVAFYRAMKLGDGPGGASGLIQFGTSNDSRRTLPPIAHEPTSKTGLTHTDGAISMAMIAPGTAAGDIFIIVGDLHTLDATATDPGFAVFGHVAEGMDVVRRILAAPTSPTEGEGVMKGQMLSPAIKVISARRTD